MNKLLHYTAITLIALMASGSLLVLTAVMAE